MGIGNKVSGIPGGCVSLKSLRACVVGALMWCMVPAAWPEEPPVPAASPAAVPAESAPAGVSPGVSTATPPLDASLQQFKRDMLEVNKRLLVMEEELLFPANAQLTVFFSLDVGRFLVPDSVTLELDGKPVQSHLYTAREVDALKRGAVQRLLTTIVKPGTHRLTAVVAGSDARGRSVRRAVSTEFDKDESQRYLYLRVVDDEAVQQAEPQFREP